MAKSKIEPGQEQGTGPDPELWQSAPEQYVSNVDTLASMTGGDAGTYEGIVDYIMTGEEQSAPTEDEIIAAQDAGMLERNYPAEVESSAEATPTPERELISGGGLTSMPVHAPPAAVTFGNTGGDVATGGLQSGIECAPEVEGVEAAAVGSLAHLSGSPAGEGGDAGGQIVQHTRDDLKLYKAAAGSDPSSEQALNASSIGELDGVVSSLTAQIDSLMGGLSGSMEGVYSSSQGTIDSTFSSSFEQVSAAFDEARSQADLGAEDALARIEQSTVDGYAHVDATSEQVLSEVSTLIGQESSNLNSAGQAAAAAAEARISAGQQEAQQLTDQAISNAGDIGTSMAEAYRGRGNSGTEGKRDEARAQVAEQVAAAYQEDLPSAGTDTVASMEAEKENVRASIDALINPIINRAYPDLLTGTQQSVEEGSQAVKDDIAASNEEAVASVEEEHLNITNEMNQQEAMSLGQLASLHETANENLDATNETGQSGLEAMGNQMEFHIAQKKAQLATLIGSNPMIPNDKLGEEVSLLEEELNSAGDETNAAMESHEQNVAQTMNEITTDAVDSMNTVTEASVGVAGQLGTDAVAAFDELATGFETAVGDTLDRYDNALEDLQTQIEEQCARIYNDVTGYLDSGQESVDQGVTEFLDGFDQSLHDAVHGTGDDQMVGTIDRIAEEEAAKIEPPSFWDRVVQVVAVLVVIAVIVAIAVLVPMAVAALPAVAGVSFAATGGALTLLGSIAVGAITSFATEIVMQFVAHGFDFEAWDGWKILRETFVGGVIGGLTFGVGAVLKNSATAGRAALTAANQADDVTRLQRIAIQLTDDAGNLNVLGDYVTGQGMALVGDVLKAGLGPDQLPSIQDILIRAGSGVVTTGLSQGVTNYYQLPDNDWRGNAFTSFIEEVSKEVAKGDIQAAFETIDIDPAEVGGGDFTDDYEPTWQPTW